jgi:hypothetical protein
MLKPFGAFVSFSYCYPADMTHANHQVGTISHSHSHARATYNWCNNSVEGMQEEFGISLAK